MTVSHLLQVALWSCALRTSYSQSHWRKCHSKNDKKFVCLCSIHSTGSENWYMFTPPHSIVVHTRPLPCVQVCAFSHETDPDMKGKVLLRLTNITHVQGLLEKALANTLGWWPPSVNSWVPTHKPRKGKRFVIVTRTPAQIHPLH